MVAGLSDRGRGASRQARPGSAAMAAEAAGAGDLLFRLPWSQVRATESGKLYPNGTGTGLAGQADNARACPLQATAEAQQDRNRIAPAGAQNLRRRLIASGVGTCAATSGHARAADKPEPRHRRYTAPRRGWDCDGDCSRSRTTA